MSCKLTHKVIWVWHFSKGWKIGIGELHVLAVNIFCFSCYFGELVIECSFLENYTCIKGMTEDEVVGWHHWLSGHEFEQAPGDGEGHRSLECRSPRGHKEWTWLSGWTTTNKKIRVKVEAHSDGNESLHLMFGNFAPVMLGTEWHPWMNL